jgi:dynein heavy chain 2
LRDDFSLYEGILSPVDEFQYWADMARSDERASQFVDLFKPISKEFGGLDTMDMQDVMELVEVAQDTLDDVWKCLDFDAYPEARMKHLMDIIGMTFLSFYNGHT